MKYEAGSYQKVTEGVKHHSVVDYFPAGPEQFYTEQTFTCLNFCERSLSIRDGKIDRNRDREISLFKSAFSHQ